MSLAKRIISQFSSVVLIATLMVAMPLHSQVSPASAAPNDTVCELPGYGLEDYPYLVDSPQDFAEIQDCDDTGVYFLQRMDVEFGDSWPGIVEFDGHFDGNGRVISGLLTNQPTTSRFIGLFGDVSEGSSIRNVTIRDSIVEGNDRVGALAGSISEGVIIDNIKLFGVQVMGSDFVGLLAGTASSTISNVMVSDAVASAPGNIGGLVGTFFAQGDSGQQLRELALSRISMKSVTVEHLAGNSNTRMGALVGLLISGENVEVDLTDLSIQVALEDAGSLTEPGVLFGGHSNGDLVNLPISASHLVLDIAHEAINPAPTRPLNLLGSFMEAVSFNVSRIVASVSSEQVASLSSPSVLRDLDVELLGGLNHIQSTPVSAAEIYFDTDRHPVGDFTFTTQATPKTFNQLGAPDLYLGWSRTSDISDLFEQPDAHTWFQEDLKLPWLAQAFKIGAGNASQFNLYAPASLANVAEFGYFEIISPGVSADIYRLEVRATNHADDALISILPPENYKLGNSGDLPDGTVRFEGTLEHIGTDLKRHILDPTHTAVQVDLSIKLWFADYLDATLLNESLSLPVLGCNLQGSGTEVSPYLIQTQGDLSQVMACDDQGIFFEQTADIRMERPHVPIGHDSLKFQGIYDGGNFGITNLVNNIPLGSSQGLFGVVGDGGEVRTQTTIKNLTVEGSVQGNRDIGLLVGDVDDLKVSNVTLVGQVTGQSSIGLLAGDAEHLTAIGIVAVGKAYGVRDEIGLVVGDGWDSDIWLEDIVIEGQVVGNEQLGALAGELGREVMRGLVRNVTAHVDVIALDRHGDSHIQERVGGLVGNSQYVSYSNVSVYGLEMPGRVGRVFIHDDPTQTGTSRRHAIGGLIGDSSNDIVFEAQVEIDVVIENPGGSDRLVGGLVGNARAIQLLEASFDGEVIGHDEVGGIFGKIRMSEEDSGVLISNVSGFVEVTGSGSDVGGFAGNVNHGSSLNRSVYIRNVDVYGTALASGNGLVGGFIGEIHVSKHFDDTDNWNGTVTILNSSADVDVVSEVDGHAGGFIGLIEPEAPIVITDSFAAGNVTGTDEAGGFIAEIYSGVGVDDSVTITRSFATGDVFSTGDDVGGFIGWLDTRTAQRTAVVIDQSYATGSVTGGISVGGFVGNLDGGVITNSFATGNVLGNHFVGGFAGTAREQTVVGNSYTSSDASLRNPVILANLAGRFTAALANSTLTSVGWNSDQSATDEYTQAVMGPEFEINNDNLESLTTYSGWSISDTLLGTETIWVICPELSTKGPILWYQAKNQNGLCSGTRVPDAPISLNTGGTPLDFDFFMNLGTFSGPGFYADYLDVIPGSEYQVDARVTVLETSQIDSYDCSGSGFDAPNNLVRRLDSDQSTLESNNRWIRLQLQDICLLGAEEGFVEFKVEFFIGASPVELEQLVLNITDVDDRQFVEVSGFDRYSLSEGTILSPRIVDGVTRIEETQDLSTDTSDSTSDFDFIGSALTVGRVQFEFDSTSEIIIKAGANKNGGAYFDFDFSSGGEWVDNRGAVEVFTLVNPVIVEAEAESVANVAAPYNGPVVLSVNPQTVLASGGDIELTGTNLETVSRIQIDGVNLVLNKVESGRILATVPAGLTLGLKDAELTSDFGKLSIPGLFRVVAQSDAEFSAWTSLKGDFVKVYAKNLVGAGKVQFLVNGVERAWIRAIDQSDPKLRRANGFDYLVRSIRLTAGKNTFEVYRDGERVWRSAYTQR